MADDRGEPIPGGYCCDACRREFAVAACQARRCPACGSDYVSKVRRLIAAQVADVPVIVAPPE